MADLLGCRSYLSTDCQKHYQPVLTKKSANTVANLLWFKKWHETNDDSYREKIILGNMKDKTMKVNLKIDMLIYHLNYISYIG